MHIHFTHVHLCINLQSQEQPWAFLEAQLVARALLLTATATRLLHWSAGVYFHVRFIVRGSCHWSHSVLYLRCHRHESLFHICGVFRTCLQEWNS